MTTVAAIWGLGYAALLVAVLARVRATVRRYVLKPQRFSQEDAVASQWIARALSLLGSALLWSGLIGRAWAGHGWPIVTVADAAVVVGLLMLFAHNVWSLLGQGQVTGLLTLVTVLVLLSYGLGRMPGAPLALPLELDAALWSDALNLFGASLLGLAATFGATVLMRAYAARQPSQGSEERVSETLVRAALLCLAVGLALDTWWLQDLTTGRQGSFQQAGIAVAWIVYFAAVRLRGSARWRGWPWVSVLVVGFACTLPLLLAAPWLDDALPI